MKAGTSGAEKAAAGNCKRICIRRPVLSGKKTVQVFLWGQRAARLEMHLVHLESILRKAAVRTQM